MEFLKEFGIGNLITIGAALLGGFAGYLGLKFRVTDLEKVAAEAKVKAETTERAMTDFKIQAAEKFVTVTSMREFKEDIQKEVKEIEHTIRGLLQGKFGRGQA